MLHPHGICLVMRFGFIQSADWGRGGHNIRVPNFSRKKTLSDEEGRHLLKLYCELYKVSESQVAEMCTIYLQYTHINKCSINCWALAKAELLHHH